MHSPPRPDPVACARAAAAQAGLDAQGAHVLRVGASVLVRLPAAGAVARIEPPEAWARADRQARCGGAAHAAGAPVAPLLAPRPITVDGGVVTLWGWVQADAPVDAAALGRGARALHDATRGVAAQVPAFDPFATLRARIGAADLDADTRGRLVAAVEALVPRWDAAVATDPGGQALVHGDLHRENALGVGGEVVLVDLELAGFGPATFDLAPAFVAADRYGRPPEELRRFLAGYGADPRGWGGLGALTAVYELLVTTWVLAVLPHAPQFAEEARIRLDGVLGGPRRVWTLL